jgi:SAM-dependent methyltransferase
VAGMTYDEMKRIYDSVGDVRGWDFSQTKTDRDPIPWDYSEIVQRYLRPSSHVLDIATGGGEVFLALAPHFGSGIGTDSSATMIQTAQENTPPALADKVSFVVMQAQDLTFSPEAFDMVLNRHGPVFVDQVVPLLRPQGYFITQQVAGRNFQSVFSVFGWGSTGAYWQRYWQENELLAQDVASLRERLTQAGCSLIAYGEYDVPFYFLDVASLLFFLKAIPLPEDFDIERHWEHASRLIAEYSTPKGIETSEHRQLLIAQKPE